MFHDLARFVLALVSAAISVSAANAANIYWAGTGTSWNTRAFWSTASNATTPNPVAVPGAGDVAIFNISTVNATQTMNLDAAQSAAGLNFNSTGTVAIQTGVGTNALTIGTSGITVNSSAGADTISSMFSLGGTQSWTNNSNNLLTVNGDVSNGSNSLTIAGTGNTAIGGVLGNGSGGLTKLGSGTLTLSGNNSFSGGLTVQQGTLRIATINDVGTTGTLGDNTGVTFGSDGQTGRLEFTGASATSNMPFAIDGSGAAAFQVDSAAATLTLTSDINGGFSAAVTKTGAGTLDLTGSTGGTLTINGGTLVQDGGRMLSNIIINNGATFAYNGGDRGGTVFIGSGQSLMKVIGTNTLEITFPVTISDSSSITVDGGGTLRFKDATNSIGTGGRITISNDGTAVELAGPASALSSGANRASISNGSRGNNNTAAGLLVSGGNQVVGGIDGTGSTEVDAGSSLTVDHIIQSALVIGGVAGNAAIVAIAASDSSGNPLADAPYSSSRISASSLIPSNSFVLDGGVAHGADMSPFSIGGGPMLDALSLSGTPAVPEPSSLLLALWAAAGAGVVISARRSERSR